MNRGMRPVTSRGRPPGLGVRVRGSPFRRTLHDSPGWGFCPFCWGQRRIWEPVQARNGEGEILVGTACPACLGIGEVNGDWAGPEP